MDDAKSMVVERLMNDYNFKKEMAYRVVGSVLDVVHEATRKYNKFRVGSHVFKVLERKARMGRNPKTGEALKIAASRKVVYKNSTDKKKN